MNKPILFTLLSFMPLYAGASCAPPSLSTGFEDRSDTAITEFTVDGLYHSATFSGGLANIPSPVYLTSRGEKAWQVYSVNHASAPDSTGNGTITLTPPATELQFYARAAPDVMTRIQALDTGNYVVLERNIETTGHSVIAYHNDGSELPIEEIRLIVDGGSGQAAIDDFYFQGVTAVPPCNDVIVNGSGSLTILVLFVLCLGLLCRSLSLVTLFKEGTNNDNIDTHHRQ
jgi:hypothetical protein